MSETDVVAAGSAWTQRLVCYWRGHNWGDWGAGMDDPEGGRMCRTCGRIVSNATPACYMPCPRCARPVYASYERIVRHDAVCLHAAAPPSPETE